MKKAFLILLTFLPTFMVGQNVDNKTDEPIQVRIWQDGKIVKEQILQPNEYTGLPTSIFVTPMMNEVLLQAKFINPECDPCVGDFDQFDGEYYNLLINYSTIRKRKIWFFGGIIVKKVPCEPLTLNRA